MEVATRAATGAAPLGATSSGGDNQQHEAANVTTAEAGEAGTDSKSKKKKKKKKKSRRKSVEKTQAEGEAALAAAAHAAAQAKDEPQPQDDEDEEDYETTVKLETVGPVESAAEAEKAGNQAVSASTQAKQDAQTTESSNQTAEQAEPAVEAAPELEAVGIKTGEEAPETGATVAGAVDEAVKAEVAGQQDGKSEAADNQQEALELATPALNKSSQVQDETAQVTSTEKLSEPLVLETPSAEEAPVPSPPSEEKLAEPLVVQTPTSEEPPAPLQSPAANAKKAPSSSNSPVRSLMSRFTTKLGRRKAPSRSESIAKLESATPSPVKSAVKRLEVHEEASLDDLPVRTKCDFFGSDEERSIHVSAEKEKYDSMEKQRQLEDEAAAAADAQHTPPSSTSSASAIETTELSESAKVDASAELKEAVAGAETQSGAEESTKQTEVQATTSKSVDTPVQAAVSSSREAASTEAESSPEAETEAVPDPSTVLLTELTASNKAVGSAAPLAPETTLDATLSEQISDEAPTSETEKVEATPEVATSAVSEPVTAVTELLDPSQAEAAVVQTEEDAAEAGEKPEAGVEEVDDAIVESPSAKKTVAGDVETTGATVETPSEQAKIPEVPLEPAMRTLTAAEAATSKEQLEAAGDAAVNTVKAEESISSPSKSAIEAPKLSGQMKDTGDKPSKAPMQLETSALSSSESDVAITKSEENVQASASTAEPLSVSIAPPAPGSPPTATKTQSKPEKQSPVRSLASRFEGKQEQSLDSLKFRTVREFFPQERSIRVGAEKQKYESITEQQKLKAKAEEDLKANRKSGSPHQPSKSPSSGAVKTVSPIAVAKTPAISSPSSGAKDLSTPGSQSGSPASSDHSAKKEDGGSVTPVKSIASRFEGKREQSLDSLKFRTVREFFPTGDERSIRVGAEKAKYEALSKQQQETAKLAEEQKSKRANSPPSSGTGKVRAISHASESSNISVDDNIAATKKQQDDAPVAEFTKVATEKEPVQDMKEPSVVETATASTEAPVAEDVAPTTVTPQIPHDGSIVDIATASETLAPIVSEDVAVQEPLKTAEAEPVAPAEAQREVVEDAVAVPEQPEVLKPEPVKEDFAPADQPKDASKEAKTPDQAKLTRKPSSGGSRGLARRRTDSKSRPMLTTERSFVMDDQTIETEDTVVVSERPLTDDEKENSVSATKEGLKTRKTHQTPASAGTKKTTKAPSPARSASQTPKLTRKASTGSTVAVPMKRASITAPTASSIAKKDDGHAVAPPVSKHSSSTPKPKGTVGPTGFIKPPPAASTVPVPMKRASITAPTASSQARKSMDKQETKAPHSGPKRHSAKVKGTVGPTGFIKPAPPPPTVPVAPKRASIMAPTASYRAKKAAEEAALVEASPALNLATRNSRYAKVPSKVLEGIQSGSMHTSSKKTITKADYIAAERRKSLGSAGVRNVLEADRRASIGGRRALDIPEPFVRSASQQKKVDKALPRYMDYQNSPAYARVAQEQYERRKRLEAANALKSEKRQKELRMFFADQHQKAISTAQDEVRRGQELHEYARLAKESEIAEKKARRKERAHERAARTHDRESMSSSSSGPSQSSSAAPRQTKKPSTLSSVKPVAVTTVEPPAMETEAVLETTTSLEEAAPIGVVESDGVTEKLVEVVVKEEGSVEVAALETPVGDEDLTLEKVAKKINFDDASSDSDEKSALSQ